MPSLPSGRKVSYDSYPYSSFSPFPEALVAPQGRLNVPRRMEITLAVVHVLCDPRRPSIRQPHPNSQLCITF